jgi:hypothetical protein
MSPISSNYRPASGLTQSFNTPPAARFKHCEDAYFLPCYTQNVKKVGRLIRRPKQVCPQMSAHVGDALLAHPPRTRSLAAQVVVALLSLAQERQQHGPPIWKFERIVSAA